MTCVFGTVGNGCNSLNLHSDPLGFWQLCLHAKSDPLNLQCVTYTILYCVMHCIFVLQLNRVKAVEKEKDELEGAKNEAVEFLTSENAIVRLKNKLYQKYM